MDRIRGTAGSPAPTSTPVADAHSTPVPLWAMFQNVATAYVLDSNELKAVYTEQPNGGPFQQWMVSPSEGDNIVMLRNGHTPFYLDSNEGKAVYTNDGNGGPFQKWVVSPSEDEDNSVMLRNLATGFYLESNWEREVYTNDGNGSEFQQWLMIGR